jgi:alpha 1,3-glucosidase
VEKVVFVGAPDNWSTKTEVQVLEEGGSSSGGKKVAGMTFHKGKKGQGNWAVVRDPAVGIGKGWKIEF